MVTVSFDVVIECRPRGAIGLFSPVNFYVSQPSEDSAIKAAFNEAQNAGYETRFVVSCNVI